MLGTEVGGGMKNGIAMKIAGNSMVTFTNETTGGVLHLQIGQDSGVNLMQDEWSTGLQDALEKAATNPAIRCIYISAKGKSFSNGADLRYLKENSFPNGIMNSPLAGLLALLETYEKPIVAAVHGAVVGGGVTILLYFDFVYSDESTVFQLPFTKLGIIPELGSSYLLKHFAGQRLAHELILLSKQFDAATALRAGIINEIVAREKLEERAVRNCSCVVSLASWWVTCNQKNP